MENNGNDPLRPNRRGNPEDIAGPEVISKLTELALSILDQQGDVTILSEYSAKAKNGSMIIGTSLTKSRKGNNELGFVKIVDTNYAYGDPSFHHIEYDADLALDPRAHYSQELEKATDICVDLATSPELNVTEQELALYTLKRLALITHEYHADFPDDITLPDGIVTPIHTGIDSLVTKNSPDSLITTIFESEKMHSSHGYILQIVHRDTTNSQVYGHLPVYEISIRNVTDGHEVSLIIYQDNTYQDNRAFTREIDTISPTGTDGWVEPQLAHVQQLMREVKEQLKNIANNVNPTNNQDSESTVVIDDSYELPYCHGLDINRLIVACEDVTDLNEGMTQSTKENLDELKALFEFVNRVRRTPYGDENPYTAEYDTTFYQYSTDSKLMVHNPYFVTQQPHTKAEEADEDIPISQIHLDDEAELTYLDLVIGINKDRFGKIYNGPYIFCRYDNKQDLDNLPVGSYLVYLPLKDTQFSPLHKLYLRS